jgi:hypothetical protein
MKTEFKHITLSKHKIFLFELLGFILTFITFGITFILFYDYFFLRESYLNKKLLIEYIKNNTMTYEYYKNEDIPKLNNICWNINGYKLFFWIHNKNYSLHYNDQIIFSSFSPSYIGIQLNKQLDSILQLKLINKN